MDAKLIDTLAALSPNAIIPRITVANAHLNHNGSPLHAQAKEQFISMYRRESFGWYIATQFAVHKMRFPIPMMNRNAWVFRAYLMQLDPWNNHNKDIATAYHLAHTVKGMPELGDALKTLILSIDNEHPAVHMGRLAKITGLTYDTIEAFESLFYNILDRREDGFYIASEVYPKTRIVELAESYMNDSTYGDLMKRAGYNHRDLDMSAYLLGIGDKSYVSKIAASETREAELSTLIMGNGLIFAATNLLNNRSIGLSRAAQLMVASRQAGVTTDEPTLTGIAPLYQEAFRQVAMISETETLERMRSDAGMVVDV